MFFWWKSSIRFITLILKKDIGLVKIMRMQTSKYYNIAQKIKRSVHYLTQFNGTWLFCHIHTMFITSNGTFNVLNTSGHSALSLISCLHENMDGPLDQIQLSTTEVHLLKYNPEVQFNADILLCTLCHLCQNSCCALFIEKIHCSSFDICTMYIKYTLKWYTN